MGKKMKFEIGKFYKTRDGHRAQIFMLDNGAGFMMGVVLQANSIWFSNHWRCDGTIYIDSDSPDDLISEWQEPKTPKLMAPAILKTCEEFSVSLNLYSSEKEAREYYHDALVSWPAVPNKDGFYEVME
jgi:hypothetical protein